MQQSQTLNPVRRRFSMIRSFILADLLTLGNGFCGSGSVLSAMQFLVTGDDYWLVISMALLPVALAFDFADGRVARWRRRSSMLGADLDSLADVISFGLAPAALGFAAGLRGAIDVVILLYFVACGISRLARFNATADALSDESGKVKYFEGTPIPTSVVLIKSKILNSEDRLGMKKTFLANENKAPFVHLFRQRRKPEQMRPRRTLQRFQPCFERGDLRVLFSTKLPQRFHD